MEAFPPQVAPVASEEEEELEDVPAEEKAEDPLMRARVKKGGFGGVVEEVERGVVSKDLLYRVRYDDMDLEHFTVQQVRDHLETPLPLADDAKAKAKAKSKAKAKGKATGEQQEALGDTASKEDVSLKRPAASEPDPAPAPKNPKMAEVAAEEATEEEQNSPAAAGESAAGEENAEGAEEEEEENGLEEEAGEPEEIEDKVVKRPAVAAPKGKAKAQPKANPKANPKAQAATGRASTGRASEAQAPKSKAKAAAGRASAAKAPAASKAKAKAKGKAKAKPASKPVPKVVIKKPAGK